MPNRISHLLALITVILTLALTPAAQSTTPADCPTITVNGPAGMVDTDPFKFTAKVKGNLPYPVKYEWTVSKGQIIEGHGTLEITVLDPEGEGSLTATVEVIGLPNGCWATASETTPPREYVHAVLIDEVELPITKISNQMLRTAAEGQKNNPSNNLYVIVYTDKDVSQFDVRRAVKRVSDFLIKEMKLTVDHFEFETVRSETNSVKIYRLPPGSEKPSP